MKSYRVQIEIDVVAASYRAAAEKAYDELLDVDLRHPLRFDVFSENGGHKCIDLDDAD